VLGHAGVGILLFHADLDHCAVRHYFDLGGAHHANYFWRQPVLRRGQACQQAKGHSNLQELHGFLRMKRHIQNGRIGMDLREM